MCVLFGGLVAGMAIGILYLKRPTRRPSPLGIRYIIIKTADGELPQLLVRMTRKTQEIPRRLVRSKAFSQLSRSH